MKLKKGIVCFLAAVLLVPCFIGSGKAFSIAAAEGDNGFKFSSNGDWCAVYWDSNKGQPTGDIVIPSVSPDGHTVTSVGEMAFSGCTKLTGIKLPQTVKHIQTAAFSGCTALKSVEMPCVESIGEMAFSGCKELSEIEIPSSTTVIYQQAFISSGLKSVRIPAALTGIRGNVFCYSPELESITVDEGNPAYYSDGNCLIETETGTLIAGCKNSAIPSGVTTIAGDAFNGCTGLAEIEIPSSVTTIASEAFMYCEGLTQITIPQNVKSVGYWSFRHCPSLRRVTIESAAFLNDIRDDSDDDSHIFKYAAAVNIRADIDGELPSWFTDKFTCRKDITLNGTAYVLYATPSAESVDETTGVSLSAGEGVLPTSTVLTVESSDYVTESAEKYTAFDISLEVDGVKVQPNGNVKVSLPIPEGYDRTRLTIYRVEEDGSETELACTVEGDFAVFETDHFSVYVLAEKTASEPSDSQGGGTGSEPSDTQGGGTGSQDGEGNTQFGAPQTGDGRDLLIWTALLCASSAAVFTVVYRRKRVK